MADVSTPTGTNASAQLGNTITKDVVQIGVTSGETLLFLDYPFLAAPGLKQLVELVISFLSGYVVKGLSQVVTFTIIDVQVSAEKTDFNKALSALKVAQASGDVNAIASALHNFQIAALNLGHSDGSAPF